MGLIPCDDLIKLFQRMNAERWEYEWGKAESGCVDCSGAFVYAYKRFGKSIYHGSNRIARVNVEQLLPITQAKPGMVAFKRRDDSSAYYNLGTQYQRGGAYYNGDTYDYYHVGLVDSNPDYVLNAQSEKTGFQRNWITSWSCVGYLK